ncbi:putative phage-associated protein [Pseudaminobacter salicylatoxidans]|uniref:Putative phage-associated protein n=2 Tax=Pseudaminobacter salicylatoxidans TaxID=93369 RepID=A0A316CCZ3_PSESE|nr:putative phage-associated protein [Pseudaminobacter salicylatoxidans]
MWKIGSQAADLRVVTGSAAKLQFAVWRLLLFVKSKANHYVSKQEEAVNPVRLLRRRGKRCIVSNMTYTPQHIANYFLDSAAQEGGRLSLLKLLKLIYIAYGWSLALRNEKLFNEKIEAWQHGPVIPSIYHEFKHYGSSPIASRSVTVDFKEKDGKLNLDFQTPRVPDMDEDTIYILDTVWKSYKDFTAWALRELTHQDGTPWRKVYRDGVRGIAMQDEDIREHYVERIGRYLEAARATEQERKAS